MNEKVENRFTCERCRIPFIVSFSEVMVDKTVKRLSKKKPNPSPNKVLSSASSFSPNSHSQLNIKKNYDEQRKLRVIKELFDYGTEKTHIDHPLCTECCQFLIKKNEKNLQDLNNDELEYDEYQLLTFKNQFENIYDLKELKNKNEELKKEEEKLKKEIKEYENENENLMNEKELKLIEDEYWREFNSFQINLFSNQEERNGLKQKIQIGTSELKKLYSTNVYNDLFHIWFDGHFGTINNFRIGKLSTESVEWNEINAGLGQSALLLLTISNKLNYQFKQYSILPLGSFSQIISGYTTKYELYGGQGGFFWSSKFDKALIGYFDCLKQLIEFVKQKDSSFLFPYE
eukprot:gene10825-3443_t